MKNDLKVTKILDQTFREIPPAHNPVNYIKPRMLVCKAEKHVPAKYVVLYIDPNDQIEKVNTVAYTSSEEVADMICANYQAPTS